MQPVTEQSNELTKNIDIATTQGACNIYSITHSDVTISLITDDFSGPGKAIGRVSVTLSARLPICLCIV